MRTMLARINPLYKAVFVTVSAIALSFTYSVTLNVCVFFVSILLLTFFSKKILRALRMLIPVVFCAAGLLVTGLFFGGRVQEGVRVVSVSSFETGLQLSSRVFAFAGLGLLFSLTTEPNPFIASLRRAGMPRKFAYGLLCAFNLLPQIKQEYENARLAVRIRGVRINPFSLKPVFSTLANCIRWSEALSMAMQSKGFEE